MAVHGSTVTSLPHTSTPDKVNSAPPPERRTRSRSDKMNARGARTGWLFIAPFGIVFVAFLLAPLAYALYLSLFTKGLATGTRFSGLENYLRAFSDPQFLKGVWFVVRFSLVLIPVQMAVSLAAALVLDHLTTRLARFSRLMIFLPYAVPAVIGALMWGFLYSPTFGPLEQFFSLFHASAPFLLSQDNVFYGLLNVVTWQWAGYYMIIIYAALQGIDPTLYEAAKIDGASERQVAFRIKIPLVSSALVLILIFALIGTLQFFSEPQILGPVANGSITPDFTPNIYAFNLAFGYAQFNYASAISFSLGIVVFIAVYIFMFATRKKGSNLS
ncbi:carbohydrate ABC transporter permease [Arthrobacter bambusae]|uniref:Multiple sugar transport system permease protein n=1 Tax=Arthrobacter bambusae TaxID=1338426 RepID=A0AAW8DDE8_9MICC|nr:sugar ABC transporter permease [Arthrobacter bambusae]MDP9904305.1 multiple sugar transport system permease protein [Arthrobacter bambusae]MDQ0127699.1 multiple sugar transport system permease protein [Arthrobacter bambusae]MDQ0179042.1 multiple sugar transport system permease protein [Arthrobacter bambusae]